MSAFADVAARYGIDPNNEEAVDHFFDEQAPSLSDDERAAILAELFAAQADHGDSPARTRYAKGTPDPTVNGRSSVAVPLRAVDPVRDAAELKAVGESLQSCIADFLTLSRLDVDIDVKTADDGRLEIVLVGPAAQRLQSDESDLLESIRYLVKRVADAQQVIEDADIIVHGGEKLSALEDTGGMKLRIVKMDNIPVEPMSVSGAAAKLDDSKNEFIVFRDEDTDQVTVLYKRGKRELGLIS
jgi:hypothetical protein